MGNPALLAFWWLLEPALWVLLAIVPFLILAPFVWLWAMAVTSVMEFLMNPREGWQTWRENRRFNRRFRKEYPEFTLWHALRRRD